jgi:uncharacterized tellurite resistance protein B-like protein
VSPNLAKCLVVAKVLVADGIMTDEERAFLDGMIRRRGLSDEERRQVIELEGLDGADAFVRALPVEERREIVEELVDAASADGKLSPHELAAIKRVTAALGL